MSSNFQVSLMVPVDPELLGDMSAQDIVSALKNIASNNALQTQLKLAKGAVRNFGGSLELILDEVDNPFDKAQALRTLAQDMKRWEG